MMSWFLLAALAADVPEASAPLDAPAAAGPDRSKAPEVLAPSPVELPELTTIELRPGLRLNYVRVPRVRNVSIRILWWKGIPDFDATSASAQLTSALWGTATEAYDEATLSSLQDGLDLDLGTRLGSYSSSVGIELPIDELEQGWNVLEEVVQRPVFDKRVLTRTKENLVRYYLVNGPTDPASVIGDAMDFAWYPADHPLGNRPDIAGYQKTSVKTLPSVYDQLRTKGPVDVVVVGDLELADVEAQVRKRFGNLGVPGERAPRVDWTPPQGPRVIAIPMADTEQISILHRREAPAFGTPEARTMSVIDYALGGHFLARFNKNLREDKGWTYGVGAWYSEDFLHGSYNISVDVPADKMAPAVGELQHELRALAEAGVTQAEIDAGWRSSMKGHNDTRSTTARAAATYGGLVSLELTIAERLQRLEVERTVTPEQTRALAETLFAEDAGVWIFLGPRGPLEAGLKALDLTAEWVEPAEALLGSFKGP